MYHMYLYMGICVYINYQNNVLFICHPGRPAPPPAAAKYRMMAQRMLQHS